jgi:FlaA1/EpsC-like NDP-sugar epimerase
VRKIQRLLKKVLIREVINNLARTLGMNPMVEIIGLQKGEKLNEELYDGEVVTTRFPSIMSLVSRDDLKISDLILELKHPSSHLQAREFLTHILKSAHINFSERISEG